MINLNIYLAFDKRKIAIYLLFSEFIKVITPVDVFNISFFA